ncbi:hypothetical protein ACTGWM_09685 [Streptococcus suis]
MSTTQKPVSMLKQEATSTFSHSVEESTDVYDAKASFHAETGGN